MLAALTMLGSVSLASAQDVSPVPATETLYISAGCPATTTGTCTSTRWLGKTKGTATSNYTDSTTPVDEVYYRVYGSLNWRDYASDESFRNGGYALRADAPVVQTIVIPAPTGIAPTTWVHGRVEAVTAAGETITFGPKDLNVALLPGAGPTTVTFEFDVADQFDGVTIESATAYIAMHGANVNAGHLDQKGASKVTIPHWVPATTTP
jgi:hypothetical protein